MNLTQAVREEGYTLVVDPRPWARPDIIGDPHEPDLWPHCVLLCTGNVLAATGDSWDWAYSAAHEIAEDRHGHEHTVEVWAEQAGLLGKWLAMVTATEALESRSAPVSAPTPPENPLAAIGTRFRGKSGDEGIGE